MNPGRVAKPGERRPLSALAAAGASALSVLLEDLDASIKIAPGPPLFRGGLSALACTFAVGRPPGSAFLTCGLAPLFIKARFKFLSVKSV